MGLLGKLSEKQCHAKTQRRKERHFLHIDQPTKFNLVSEIARYATLSQFFREVAHCTAYVYWDFQSDGDANIDSCHSPRYVFHFLSAQSFSYPLSH